MAFQHCVQPQHCVEAVEPHECNLEVLNAFAWAPWRALETLGDLCGHVQGSAEELQGARGSLGLLHCSLSFLGKVQ